MDMNHATQLIQYIIEVNRSTCLKQYGCFSYQSGSKHSIACLFLLPLKILLKVLNAIFDYCFDQCNWISFHVRVQFRSYILQILFDPYDLVVVGPCSSSRSCSRSFSSSSSSNSSRSLSRMVFFTRWSWRFYSEPPASLYCGSWLHGSRRWHHRHDYQIICQSFVFQVRTSPSSYFYYRLSTSGWWDDRNPCSLKTTIAVKHKTKCGVFLSKLHFLYWRWCCTMLVLVQNNSQTFHLVHPRCGHMF